MGKTATVGWDLSNIGQSPAMPAWRWLGRQTNHWLGKVGFSVCRTATLAELRAARGSLEHSLAEHQAIKHRLAELDRQLALTVNARFPVYLIDGPVPAAAPTLGASPHPLVVCTIPKSGTYLVSELLERLGCVPTRLHLSRHSLTDYRFASLREAREEYERFQVDLRLETAVRLLLPGQFAVGHLECSNDVRDCLGRAKKIFTYRNLRDGLVSYMRFLASTGRGGDRTAQWKDLPAGPEQMLSFLDHAGHEFFGLSLPLLGWVDEADVLKLSFESIYGDHGPTEQQQAIDRLHSFLELPGPVPGAADLVRSILGTPTITWSGGRARRETYWNGEVERRFIDFGGAEANVRLGYDN
jgi:hypothetical protein